MAEYGEWDTETFQGTVGRKLKMSSLALAQDTRVVRIQIGGDQKPMGNAEMSPSNLHARIAVLHVCLWYVDTPQIHFCLPLCRQLVPPQVERGLVMGVLRGRLGPRGRVLLAKR